jgi:hypothetical protein
LSFSPQHGGKFITSKFVCNVYFSKECAAIENDLEEVYWMIKLLDLPYDIGKVDVTNNKEIAKIYALEGVPTFLFFK